MNRRKFLAALGLAPVAAVVAPAAAKSMMSEGAFVSNPAVIPHLVETGSLRAGDLFLTTPAPNAATRLVQVFADGTTKVKRWVGPGQYIDEDEYLFDPLGR